MSFDAEELYDITEISVDVPRGDPAYTPTTETVRAMYATDYYMVEVRGHKVGDRAAAFDRWLAEHDAAVTRAALASHAAGVAEAVAVLRADVGHGEYSGGGYRYVEATPEALRHVLAKFD